MAGEDPAVFSSRGLTVLLNSSRGGFDASLVARLVQFIDETESSLHCAIYDLRHPHVLAALRRVSRSGKDLMIAYDAGAVHSGGLMADPKPTGTEQKIRQYRLVRHSHPLHEIGGHLMHDKFLVRDGRSVWTGSANFTVGGLELQDNNCVTVTSASLARQYEQVFQSLITSPAVVGLPAAGSPVSAAGTSLTPSFAPGAGEGIEGTIVQQMNQATRLRVLAFLISDPGILQALLRFKDDPKLDVKGVYDPNGMNDVLRFTKQPKALFWFMDDPRFVKAPSHPFNPKREQDFMHNKVMILDDHLVITGSYNFSENAETNEENLLLIDAPAVAHAYTAYFDALAAVPPP